MISKLLFNIVILLVIGVCIFVIYNSQRTFEAKFKNIDGLPIGAQVTALGVRVGEVVRTKTTDDGVIVTVRITNSKFGRPEPGSLLTITSFRPNQGRVLEIIPAGEKLDDSKSWIIQEPVTNESWLSASIELLDGLKHFSETVVKHITPENTKKTREAVSKASESLNETATFLVENGRRLTELRDKITSKANETNALLVRLQKPLKLLNEVINDKELSTLLKGDLRDFSQNLTSISDNITSEKFLNDVTLFKTNILDRLNSLSTTLSRLDVGVKDPLLKQNIKDYTKSLENLNALYEMIKPEDIQELRQVAKSAREVTTELSEKTKQN